MVNLTLDFRPESAQWIAKRLFSAFIHDSPSPQVVEQIANQIVANNWEIKPVLLSLFSSEAFFSEKARNNRVKDAVTYLIGFLRTTRIPDDYNNFYWQFSHQFTGYEPTRPTSVNGWPLNKYKGSLKTTYFLSWLTGYANLLNRNFNYLTYDEVNFEVLQLVPVSRHNPTGPAIVDELVGLLGIEISADERQVLIEYVSTNIKYNGDEEPLNFLENLPGFRTKVRGLLWILTQHRNYLTF